ncbi:hypothetical protein V8E36_007217 [Tilletia maclaganii]
MSSNAAASAALPAASTAAAAAASVRQAGLRSAAAASARASEVLSANAPPYHRTLQRRQEKAAAAALSAGGGANRLASPSSLRTGSHSASSADSALSTHQQQEEGGGDVDHDHDGDHEYSGGSFARRSRAARFGSKRMGEVQVPKMMRWAVQEMISASNKQALRQDFLRVKKDARPEAPAGALTSHVGGKLPPARLALTHLAISSPARFAVLYNVLSEVRRRLELPLPSSSSLDENVEDADGGAPRHGWSPAKVIEWNCAAGEGLWAAAEAFNAVEGETEEMAASGSSAGPLQAYEGYDGRLPLLRAGMEIAAWAQSQDRMTSEESSAAQQTDEDVDEDEVEQDLEKGGEEEEDVAAEEQAQRESLPPWLHSASLEAITAAFRSAVGREPVQPDRRSPFQLRPASSASGQEEATPSETLALSSFALSELATDRDRQEHVRRMWKSGAEVVVLVDHATKRGFASIASARSFLLELGESTFAATGDANGSAVGAHGELQFDEDAERLVIGDHVFIADSAKDKDALGHQEDGETPQQQQQRTSPIGAHVVAPCPHDRPCPLLHPFKPLPAHLEKLQKALPADSGVCSFSQRVQVPTYLRKTKHSKRGEEDVRYCYVVVRRGRRPVMGHSLAEVSEQESQQLISPARRNGAASSLTMVDDGAEDESGLADDLASSPNSALRLAASRTKEGILYSLRKGDSMESIRTLEEVNDDTGEHPDAAEGNFDRVAAADAMVESDAQSERELLVILPQVLAAELEKDGAALSEEEMDAQVAAAMEAILAEKDQDQQRERAVAEQAEIVGDEEASQRQTESSMPSTSFLFDEASAKSGQSADEIPDDPAADEAAMRLESYEWPRLIKPPLKKGGHVTFDACCSSGAIERFTIPKSAGKQAYQDARKATWGDIFPHPPKNGKMTMRIPAASTELAEPQRYDERDDYIPDQFDDLYELFASKSQLKQRALSGIDQELGDVDHAAATGPRKQKKVFRPSQAIGADVIAPTARQDRRAAKARESKEDRRPKRSKHRSALANSNARGRGGLGVEAGSGSPLTSPFGAARLICTNVGLGAMGGRRLFSTSMRSEQRSRPQPRPLQPEAQSEPTPAPAKDTSKPVPFIDRHRSQYNYDIFATKPDEELTALPLVTADNLAKSATRPKGVRMLARDFIDDSLYNPHYGYFSRQAVLLPDHQLQPAGSNPADGFSFASFKSERDFMRHVEERYMHFENVFEAKAKKEEEEVQAVAARAAEAAKSAGPKQGRKFAPRAASAEGLERAQAMGRMWKARQESNSIQERDILAMAARQVWHTPTELFKPYYARAIARYLVAEYKLHNYPYDDLVIYELGAGSGALANDVLGYLEQEEPGVYARTRYNIIEISARLAEQQGQKLERHRAAGKVNITNCSFLDWKTPVAEPAFVIALEVLDNLAHDVIRYSTDSLEPYQAVVSIDQTNDMHELWEPVRDPVIGRYLDLLEEVRPGQGPPPATHLRLFPASLRKFLTEYMPLYPNLTPPHFIPTGQLRFMEVLRDYFPRHRLIASDFDQLPDALEGVDAPVVQTRYKGTVVPVTTYCVLQGFFDIFFPTDFELMEDVYGVAMEQGSSRRGSTIGQGRWSAQVAALAAAASASASATAGIHRPESSPTSSSPTPSSWQGNSFFFPTGVSTSSLEAFSQRRLRRPRLYSHAEFMERYGEVEQTVLRDGTNPMVSWYANASFFLS